MIIVGSSPGFFFSPINGTKVSLPDIQSSLACDIVEAVNVVFDYLRMPAHLNQQPVISARDSSCSLTTLKKHVLKLIYSFGHRVYPANSVSKSLLLFKQRGLKLIASVYSYLIRNKGFLASLFLTSIETSFKDTCSNLSSLSASEFFFIKQVAPF